MTLHNLPKSQSAKILGCLDKRLCDIGMCSGQEVRMIRPGNPCIVHVGGTRFGVGLGYQKMIQIEGDRNANGQS